MARRNEEGDRDDERDTEIEKRKPDPITDDEDNDGLGDDKQVRREKREQVRDTRTGRFTRSDEDDEPEERDDEFAYNIDDEEDEDDSGGSRRRRRNRARRAAAAQSQAVISSLQQEINQLKGFVTEMGRGQIGLAAGEIESQLRTEVGNLQKIDAAIADAIKNGDGSVYARGQELRDEARDRINALRYHAHRLNQQMSEATPAYAQPEQRQPQTQAASPATDPRAIALSERFMDRHPWFDPEDATDTDSQMVVLIENQLAMEGSRPNTKRHWQELERRVRERGLGSEETDVDDDYRYKRRTRPTSGRSSGRPGGTSSFKLTPLMKEALDAEGLLDEHDLNDDQLKRREKLVKQWKRGMEQARKEGKL